VRLRYVGQRTDQGEELAAYAALDVSAWTKLRPHLRLTLRIANVLDARFMVRAGVTTPGRLISLGIDGTWE
jgi:outer membrane cobalamin receptor